MFPFVPPTFILSEQACQKIKQSMLDPKNAYVTGGLLMGHAFFHRYYVVDVTTQTGNSEQPDGTFALDSSQHTGQAIDIIDKFHHSPSIMGVWHSHLCDIDASEQDRQFNLHFAQFWEGGFSLLVTMSPAVEELHLSICFVSRRGKERPCRILVESEQRKVPRRYIKRNKLRKKEF